MATQEIPSYEWERFFDEFSRVHQGWLVTMEITGFGGGGQATHNLPLEGISVAPDEVGEDQITIAAGDSPDERLTHTIDSPSGVWLKQDDEGADEALEIESFDGSMLLTFRSAVLPEFASAVRAEQTWSRA